MMRIIFSLLITLGLCIPGIRAQDILKPGHFVACGDDKVFIIDPDRSDQEHTEITWQWNAQEADDIPPEYKGYLKSLDECKPVMDNSKLLICSSSGATLLIDIASKAVEFYARTPMAHSADLLPDDRIVVANSTHKDGNNLELYDLHTPEERLFTDTLYSGHGVVWDERRQTLFVLGYQSLKAYNLENWEHSSPGLRLQNTWRIPDDGGHDLSPAGDDHLLVSSHHGVFTFDIENETFNQFQPLKDHKNVKSVNYSPDKNQTVYTIAEESWWTENIYQMNPQKTIRLPGVRLYKVRVAP